MLPDLHCHSGGYDWEGRKQRMLQEKADTLERMRRAVYNFILYIVEDRDEDERDPASRKFAHVSVEYNASELDGRKRARVETWVELQIKKYNDHVSKAKEEDPECNLEGIEEKDIRKFEIKLEEVAVTAICEMQKLQIEQLATFDLETRGNPLANEELTARFADLGYGKNLFKEMAEQIMAEKHGLMVDAFLDVYIDKKTTEKDLRVARVHELGKVLHAFLNNVDLELCLKQRTMDDKERLALGCNVLSQTLAQADNALNDNETCDTDLTELPMWRALIMKFLLNEVALEQQRQDEATSLFAASYI